MLRYHILVMRNLTHTMAIHFGKHTYLRRVANPVLLKWKWCQEANCSSPIYTTCCIYSWWRGYFKSIYTLWSLKDFTFINMIRQPQRQLYTMMQPWRSLVHVVSSVLWQKSYMIVCVHHNATQYCLLAEIIYFDLRQGSENQERDGVSRQGLEVIQKECCEIMPTAIIKLLWYSGCSNYSVASCKVKET